MDSLLKDPLVSRTQLCSSAHLQPNFLWISDHLLFPIMLLFTLSIWRIQMLNDKREREEGGCGGRRIILPEGLILSEMPPRTASPESVHQRGRGWLNYLCVR